MHMTFQFNNLAKKLVTYPTATKSFISGMGINMYSVGQKIQTRLQNYKFHPIFFSGIK